MSRHEGLAKELGAVNTELKLLRTALVGEDLQGGLVAKVNSLASKIKTARTFVDWIKPIVTALVSAGALALFLKVLSLLH